MVDGRTRNDSIVALGDATYVLRNPVHPRLACQSLLTGLVVGNNPHPHPDDVRTRQPARGKPIVIMQ